MAMDQRERALRVARARSTARLIYGALLVSIAIYGGIAFQIAGGAGTVSAKSGTATTGMPVTQLLIVFAAVSGIMSIGLIPLVRRWLLPGPGLGLVEALRKLQSTSIITWAMSEAIATYGLILAFLTFQPLYYVGFAAFSVLNFALYPPRAALWDEVAAAATGTEAPAARSL
jgi:F0F1-type ATP synthase membrane subunit c/vacuolar-type H+-ATPase subunit K